MKKILLIAGAVIVLLIAFFLATGVLNFSVGPSQQLQKEEAATEPVSPGEASFKSYRNEERGVAMQYPESWRAVEGQSADSTQVVMFVSPVETGTDMNINVRAQVSEQAENVTLQALTDMFITSHEQQYPNGIKVEEGEAVLGGLPGRYLVYRASDQGVDAQWVSVWTEKDGIPYIVTYSATQSLYNVYLPLVERMLASFEILR